MKSYIAILSAVLLTTSGCSMLQKAPSPGNEPPSDAAVPVKDQRLSTDFKREGIKVHYTLLGAVSKVEAFGYADVWKRGYEVAAEADAKDKLIKFLRGESVSSERKTKIIAKSLERSQDNTLNKYRTVDGSLNSVAEDIEKEELKANIKPSEDENSRTNSALRKASTNTAQEVSNTITVTASGRLTAIYKDKSGILEEGKVYTAVYVWTPKDQATARFITNTMDGR